MKTKVSFPKAVIMLCAGFFVGIMIGQNLPKGPLADGYSEPGLYTPVPSYRQAILPSSPQPTVANILASRKTASSIAAYKAAAHGQKVPADTTFDYSHFATGE